jgi:aminopeptidase YwaD
LKKIFVIILFFASSSAYAQDINFAKKIVDTLTSPYFWGRGYTRDGMGKAANYLAQQFKNLGLTPVKNNSFFQPFSYPVNTFPGKMQVSINGKALTPGKDFIVSASSKGVDAKGQLQQQDSTHFTDAQNRITVTIQDKLTWSVATKPADFTTIQLDRKSVNEVPANFSANIESKFISDFKTVNVCGLVKGTSKPDSIIVISAHYDHLGGMGDATFFPGANDNASGTALLLGLAKYYAANPQPYTVAFICFAGEEAGLIGSEFFTKNALFPLKNIRLVLNLDLEGTGEEGITVVNATEFTKEFALLNEVNNSGKYLAKINPRAKAANSDHYWFTEKGVPAFFLYTMGGIKAYHDVFDKAETLPMNEYEDLLKLIKGFNEKLMK